MPRKKQTEADLLQMLEDVPTDSDSGSDSDTDGEWDDHALPLPANNPKPRTHYSDVYDSDPEDALLAEVLGTDPNEPRYQPKQLSVVIPEIMSPPAVSPSVVSPGSSVDTALSPPASTSAQLPQQTPRTSSRKRMSTYPIGPLNRPYIRRPQNCTSFEAALESADEQYKITAKKDFQWRHRSHFQPLQPVPFIDQLAVTELRDPLAYFLEFFNNDFFEEVAAFTNLNAVQKYQERVQQQARAERQRKRPPVPFRDCTAKEVRQCIAIHLFMGTVKFPRIRMYWKSGFAIKAIRSAMSRNRFFEMRKYLHFVDEATVDQTDKLYKVSYLEEINQSTFV